MIKTGDNEIHFQAVFVQSKAKHEVDKLRLQLSYHGVRVVISGRASLHLQRTPKMREGRIMKHVHGNERGELASTQENYKYSNIWEQRDYWKVLKTPIIGHKTFETKEKAGGNDFGDESSSGDSTNGNSSECDSGSGEENENDGELNGSNPIGILGVEKATLQNDSFTNVKWDKDMNNLLPVHPVIKREPYFKIGISFEYFEKLLEKECYYEVEFEDSEKLCVGPWLDDDGKFIIQVGDKVDASLVRKRFGIREPASQQHANDCWAKDGNKICGVLLELDFKNDVVQIQKILRERKEGDLFICLRGGGATVSGDTTGNNCKATNKESGFFPTWQEIRKANADLLDAALRNVTLPIFIVDKKNSRKAIYLGMHYLDGFQTHRDTFDDLKRLAVECNVTLHEQKFMRFREMNYVQVNCRCIANIPRSNNAWKKLTVQANDVFAIGVKNEMQGEGLGATRNVVSLENDDAVSLEEVRNSFLESGVYSMMDRDEMVQENDVSIGVKADVRMVNSGKSTGLLHSLPAKQVGISISNLIQFIVCCSVAVFCRMMRLNLVEGTVTMVGVLRSDTWMKRLGGILRYLATPHPIRSYDAPIMALIISTGSHTSREQRRGYEWMKKNAKAGKDMLFASMFATFVGRTAALQQWCQLKKSHDDKLDLKRKKECIFYPRRSELEEILHFMFISKERDKNPMTKWKSEQFAASLPEFCNDLNAFKVNMKRIVDNIDELYAKMISILKENEGDGSKREKMRKSIKNSFRCTNDKKAQSEFISNQVLLNFEELVDILPGIQMQDCHLGFGSKTTCAWIEGTHSCKAVLLKRILQEVKKLPEDHLKMLGLFRDERNVVRVMLNKRIVDVRDVEHMLCKLWIVMARVLGKRPSVNPKLCRPHLHPLKVACDLALLLSKVGLQIARDAITEFEKSNLSIPLMFEKEKKEIKQRRKSKRLRRKRKMSIN